MDTKKFVRKPLYIDAVQVTQDNIQAVAAWADGELHDEPKGTYIKVKVQNPLTQRQTKAFVGDWVLASPRGFKVYTDSGFKSSFNEISLNQTDDNEPQPLNVFTQPNDAPQELLTVDPSDAIDGKQ
jgi:hypothetical protein